MENFVTVLVGAAIIGGWVWWNLLGGKRKAELSAKYKREKREEEARLEEEAYMAEMRKKDEEKGRKSGN